MPSLHTWNLVHQTVKLRKLKVAFSSKGENETRKVHDSGLFEIF